jgi:hypothetical protein
LIYSGKHIHTHTHTHTRTERERERERERDRERETDERVFVLDKSVSILRFSLQVFTPHFCPDYMKEES